MLSPEDQTLAAECMKLWLKSGFLFINGVSRVVTFRNGRQVLHTRSVGTQPGGRRKVPSAKQARQATRILEVARQEGFWTEITPSEVGD